MIRHQRIEKQSVVDQVCNAIKDMIINTPLNPGDRLPSEQEIAAAYSVNKLSVRMALQKLNTLGVIEKKNGEGSFVKEFSISPLLTEVVDFYESSNGLSDIEEMRTLLEGESAVKAASLAEEDEKQELRRRLDLYNSGMEKLFTDRTEENFKALIDADMAFHRQIVKMSHNQLFEEVYRMVQKLIRRHISNLMEQREDALRQLARTQDIHNELYEAICRGDGQKAKEISGRIVNSRERVAKQDAPAIS